MDDGASATERPPRRRGYGNGIAYVHGGCVRRKPRTTRTTTALTSRRPEWNGRISQAKVTAKPLPPQPNVLYRKVKGVVSTQLPDNILRRLGQTRFRRKQSRWQKQRRHISVPAKKSKERTLNKIDATNDPMNQILRELYPGADLSNLDNPQVQPNEKIEDRIRMTLPANAPSAAQECIKESRPVTRGSMTPELVFAMESELKALRHEVKQLRLDKRILEDRVRELTGNEITSEPREPSALAEPACKNAEAESSEQKKKLIIDEDSSDDYNDEFNGGYGEKEAEKRPNIDIGQAQGVGKSGVDKSEVDSVCAGQPGNKSEGLLLPEMHIAFSGKTENSKAVGWKISHGTESLNLDAAEYLSSGDW